MISASAAALPNGMQQCSTSLGDARWRFCCCPWRRNGL